MKSKLLNGISVVLPNYNGVGLLSKNLPYLYASLNNSGFEYEIIVSDDCSSDTSIDFLNQNYPDIIITKTSANSGFSHNCNNGIKLAKKTLLCVANTDIQFSPDYFNYMCKFFDDNKLFAVKGDICNYKDNTNNIINIEKEARIYFKRGFLRFNYDFSKDIDYDLQFSLLGSCFLCRTEIMKNLGGFNEIFSPFYWEDSDLALRAINAGYEVKYIAGCPVYHKISSTISTEHTKQRRKLISNRNKFIFTWLHLNSNKRWFFHIITVLFSILTRWVILDWRYYTSLLFATYRIATFK